MTNHRIMRAGLMTGAACVACCGSAHGQTMEAAPLQDQRAEAAHLGEIVVEARRITLKHDCPRDLPEINADPAMIRQALLNLALNGCQAMQEGGTLRISCHSSGRRVHIDVEDTGVGIPPENLQKIFDLYFTTKDRGSGIGLSMVYRIVQLHDGEIEVQSTPGRGTRFRLAFPKAS